MATLTLKYRFMAPRMKDLDTAMGELLVVGVFDDERPPHALAGLVDWRMDGLVSRMRLMAMRPDLPNPHYQATVMGTFSAMPDEKLLFPTQGRLPFDRVLAVGLGPAKKYDSHKYKSAVHTIVQAASAMHAAQMTLQLPGWQVAGMPARRAADVFMSEMIAVRQAGNDPPAEVCLVEVLDHQAEMDERIVEMIGRPSRT